MKRLYLATLFAVVSTVASGDAGCDLDGDGDTYRLIRENDKAVLIVNPNSVDLISVPMWCGGDTCVNLEEEADFDAGKLIITGPTQMYDAASEVLGEPTYWIWMNKSLKVEEIELSCAE